jgi:hypothetical protein
MRDTLMRLAAFQEIRRLSAVTCLASSDHGFLANGSAMKRRN